MRELLISPWLLISPLRRSVELLKMPTRDLNQLWDKELADSPAERPAGISVGEIEISDELALAKTTNGLVVRRVLI